MRLVSINLNKRLAAAQSQSALLHWLTPLNATMVAVQEATSAGTSIPESFGGFQLVAGNEEVAFWSSHLEMISMEVRSGHAITVELDNVIVCNTHLSAYSSTERARQLNHLRISLLSYSKPALVIGDFNLAPMPKDGLYGEAPSTWTTEGERAALGQFTTELELIDLTSPLRLGEQHFTFERINKGKWTKFRCDLAFAHKSLELAARYDHSVRAGSFAFTDHSACIVEGDLPVVYVPRSIPSGSLQMGGIR